ncbi:hypothetical protein AVM11_04225 [Sphingomonas melonis TY]|uniref:Uncharacterized protein n=1 Tax=Sphingomonas melonis TY TaxID=621456 RepID=A0A175Y554_9SPHN|nr:hypothetical protein BJP26_02605 [Sphingomonas melonis TY]KZB95486.1 hypothetical protein AVM11_04225 [Sphingomonas melonis TY]
MNFRGDEVEPFLETNPLQTAVLRCESIFRTEVGQILKDRRTFGEHLGIVEHERRDIAFRVDREEKRLFGAHAPLRVCPATSKRIRPRLI